MKNWIGKPSPKSKHVAGIGWLSEMDRAFTDVENRYVVMIRTIQTDWGQVEHACIRNAESTDIPWSEKQRIKNELFGRERAAVEVFPAESKLVDAAMMYHLWILPEKMSLPFSL